MTKKNLNMFWAELIVEELVRCGADYFCISPGSRSTPLVVAVARNKKANSIICCDERGLAFHALGYAKAVNKPAVVITTSGTAVANLYPAVIEASNDKVPMLILTADRPPELIDTAANQTINQERIFGSFPRWEFSFSCPTEEVPPEAVLTTIDQAVYRSICNNPGPVHINCRYRKPLEPPGVEAKDSYIKNIRNWMAGAKPFTLYETPVVTCGKETVKSLVNIINETKRGMVVVGQLVSDSEREGVLKIIKKLDWPVYADIMSGLRLTACPAHIIRYFDQELLSQGFNEFVRPSVVLHLGGRVTSKRVGEFFEQNRPSHYIVAKNNPDRWDPIHAVTTHINSDLGWLCEKLLKELNPCQSHYSLFLAQKAQQIDGIIELNINSDTDLSEVFVARHISTAVPDQTCLFISNSMPIRDVDLYGQTGSKAVSVAANRGASGIDGIISTATGFAVGKKSATTLLIGDLAFMHDINALAVVKNLQMPIIIVVVNNHGSGIFHFLPIAKCDDIFERYFAAGHNFSFGGVSETFGLDYYKVADKADFVSAYRTATEKVSPAVIEVCTDRHSNFTLRRKIKKQIISVLDKSTR